MTPEVSLEEFARMAAGNRLDLAHGAILIAQTEYPQLDPAACLLQLADLAEEARSRVATETSTYGVVNALSHFLFEEQQFRGNVDDYYDPRNSYLNDVLDRRLGIPITLSLVYLDIAQRLGVDARGIGLPGHFIVRVSGGGEHVLVDPFHRGTILSDDDCLRLIAESTGYSAALDRAYLEPVEPREFLARMLNNLKAIYMNARDYARALAVVERLVLLHPNDLHEQRLRDALRQVLSP